MTSMGLRTARRPLLDVGQVNRIVVFRALHLGDFLCSVPALRALDNLYPGAEITLIGLPWLRSIMGRFPYVDRFLEFPGYWGLESVPWDAVRSREFLERAAAYQYDLAIQMHGDGRISNSFVAQLGARKTVGYVSSRHTRGPGLDLELPFRGEENEVWRCIRVVDALGGSANPSLEFPLLNRDREELAEILSAADLDGSRPVLVVHPGASAEEKRWPAVKFASAADRIAHHAGTQVIITGTSSELGVAQEVASRMRLRAVVLAGKTSIGALAALIGRADLLITNDSGPSHLAVATGTPSVVLFGPSDPRRWAPLDKQRHRTIWAGPDMELSQIPVQRIVDESLELVSR